ncbi:MAG: R3H domain-containing nucleic acid-binding protein [Acholeplasmatales bacterium]|jgi:spoIIIJ-associated protein|nr:Jag N-terminal domain-containing protein [Acholeplasmataceae bacterium]MDY0115164.1 R3H domain-containing nucleic acid-binding protein [Acholeplasmatales bacterium]MCK9234343.1 Jag N-terminal domain-containing protein [Acholeplasmataceae bacterium]MCK9289683.1 Jag N-terminal domain-containing protein [Acholeplasmataceae bacterium]MCK9427452.1 Jag N-terminal domain-containing protein [Acholeplasmataceae bacterium]
MTKRIEFEAKTLKEAEEKAKEHFNTDLEYITLNVIREKKGILGIGSTTVYEAIFEINLAFEGKKYLDTIFHDLEIEASIEFRTQREGTEIFYNIQSNENALLIGSNGRTLQNIQLVLRTFLGKISPERVRIHLDIGGYKENKKRQLEILATKTAKEVAITGIEAKLDPMPPYERRIIHTKLSEWRDIYTVSVGEGEERAIVIKPKK